MPYQPLVDYIKNLLQKGYSPEVIRAQLIRSGYSSSMIDEAFSASSYSSAPVHHSRLKILLFVLCGAVLIILALLFFLPEKTEPQILTLSVNAPSEGNAGSFFPVSVNMQGFAQSAQGFVVVHYALYYEDLVFSKQESVPVNEMKSHSFSFTIPSASPEGRYELKVSAAYGTAKLGKSAFFQVHAPKKPDIPVTTSENASDNAFIDCDADGLFDSDDLDDDNDGILDTTDTPLCDSDNDGIANSLDADDDNDNIPDSQDANPLDSTIGLGIVQAQQLCTENCNDLDICTQDSCVGGTCQHSTIIPCCGNFVCEAGETTASCSLDCSLTPSQDTISLTLQAEQRAAQQESDAASFCEQISDQNARDECFRKIAIAAQGSSYCDVIQQERTRDNCYMYFAVNKKENICSRITDSFIKRSCESLISAN